MSKQFGEENADKIGIAAKSVEDLAIALGHDDKLPINKGGVYEGREEITKALQKASTAIKSAGQDFEEVIRDGYNEPARNHAFTYTALELAARIEKDGKVEIGGNEYKVNGNTKNAAQMAVAAISQSGVVAELYTMKEDALEFKEARGEGAREFSNAHPAEKLTQLSEEATRVAMLAAQQGDNSVRELVDGLKSAIRLAGTKAHDGDPKGLTTAFASLENISGFVKYVSNGNKIGPVDGKQERPNEALKQAAQVLGNDPELPALSARIGIMQRINKKVGGMNR